MHDAEITALIGIAVAAGIGLAIGLERGWKELDEAQDAPAGIRTFTLVGLLGGLIGWLQLSQQLSAFTPGFLAVALFALLAHAVTAWRGGDIGLTSEFAMLITFVLGVGAGLGHWAMSAGVAVGVALILGLKAEIHGLVARLDRRELLATLQLLVLSLLVLPLLPNRDVFGFEGLNPRTIGILALLISGISYVGYFSVQILGPRTGLLFTAGLGGLTSSTAVTASYARLARSNEGARSMLSAGIALACALMIPRLLIVISLLNASLLSQLVLPLLPLLVVPLLFTLNAFRSDRHTVRNGDLALSNPLSIGAAAVFAAFLTILFILLPLIRNALGDPGVYVLAVLSGGTDVDAISLSLAKDQGGGGLAERTAVIGIMLAVLANTCVKAGIAWVGSNGELRWLPLTLIGAGTLGGLIAVLSA